MLIPFNIVASTTNLQKAVENYDKISHSPLNFPKQQRAQVVSRFSNTFGPSGVLSKRKERNDPGQRTEEELRGIYEAQRRTRHQTEGKMRDAAATVAEDIVGVTGGHPGVQPEQLNTAWNDFTDGRDTARLMGGYGEQAAAHGNGELAGEFRKLADGINQAADDSFNEVAPGRDFGYLY